MSLRLIFDRMGVDPWLAGIAVFGGYWGIFLVLSALNRVLLAKDWITRLMEDLPSYVLSLGLHQQFLESQKIESGQAYLNDSSHFVFAILLVPGTWAGCWILTRVHSTLEQLRSDGLPDTNPQDVRDLYYHYRGFANHWSLRIVSLALAAATTLFFLGFHWDADNAAWWGHQNHGLTGVFFAGVEGVMVYYGTQAMTLTAFASAMFSKLISGQVVLRPFHPDGANGLAPLGRMIMVLWLLSLAIAAAICVTLFLGYLGLERLPLSWLLAIAGLIAIPAIGIAPLAASLRAIHKAKVNEIGRFEPLINGILDSAREQVRDNDLDRAARSLRRLDEIRGVYEALVSVNVWPFNPRALTLVVVVYGLQLALTVKEFLGI